MIRRRNRTEFDHGHHLAVGFTENLALFEVPIRDFLRLNADVVQLLVAQLAAQGTLTPDDVTPLFKRVVFPEGFPLRSGQRDTASPGSALAPGVAKD